MEIKTHLEQLGIKGKKTDVYLAALELGGASVIEIAKKAGIKRTSCYDILLDLKNAGLISESIKNKRRVFIGEDPEKIKKDLAQKQKVLEEALPYLKSIYNTKGVKPKIRFYESKEGLKEVYNDTLKYKTEILAFGSEDIVNLLGIDWVNSYISQRVSRGIHCRSIVPKTKIIQEKFAPRDQEQLRSMKFIDPAKYPFSIEINIYGHQKVAFISAKEQMGVIIEGTEICKTMKLIFELVWAGGLPKN